MATSGKKPGGDAPVTLHARVLLDARGVITEWNAEAERLLGHRPEEMVGQPLSSLLIRPKPDEEEAFRRRRWSTAAFEYACGTGPAYRSTPSGGCARTSAPRGR